MMERFRGRSIFTTTGCQERRDETSGQNRGTLDDEGHVAGVEAIRWHFVSKS